MVNGTADKVEFELVSPEKLLFSAVVDMVVVPGTEGDFGVLPGHAPVISLVRPGCIDIHDDGGVTRRIFVAGGFAEVNGERCTVLASEALSVDELDRGAIQARLDAARKELAAAENDEARARFDHDIAVAEAMLAVAPE
ncbi:MAG: F0F1 ATP synthase subunit epsilon [Alphaproteobacteria bacterium]